MAASLNEHIAVPARDEDDYVAIDRVVGGLAQAVQDDEVAFAFARL